MSANLEALKSEIQSKAAIFADEVAKSAIKSFAAAIAESVAEPAAPAQKAKRGRPAGKKADCKFGDGNKVVAKGMCSSHYQKSRQKAKAKEAAATEVPHNGHAAGTAIEAAPAV